VIAARAITPPTATAIHGSDSPETRRTASAIVTRMLALLEAIFEAFLAAFRPRAILVAENGARAASSNSTALPTSASLQVASLASAV
jgi:hypothetical protein